MRELNSQGKIQHLINSDFWSFRDMVHYILPNSANTSVALRCFLRGLSSGSGTPRLGVWVHYLFVGSWSTCTRASDSYPSQLDPESVSTYFGPLVPFWSTRTYFGQLVQACLFYRLIYSDFHINTGSQFYIPHI